VSRAKVLIKSIITERKDAPGGTRTCDHLMSIQQITVSHAVYYDTATGALPFRSSNRSWI